MTEHVDSSAGEEKRPSYQLIRCTVGDSPAPRFVVELTRADFTSKPMRTQPARA